ncbi:hypothetical protein PIROE2DRAFT_16819 [Piromyces sp. E2]|nr:hypothetical protein PIROE2DRAFT_16819 [Piromyces sp. E2]|eukprot:OUM58024.1 hypothetical protein PIROE2DRAFT_16819 [Piromyces sp. E2]
MTKDKKEEEHLPMFGVGPYYNFGILAISILVIVFRNTSVLSSGKIPSLQVPFLVIGIILIIIGIFVWALAIIVSKIDKGIKENKLVTTGIYAWVRNPIYSGCMFISSGMVIAAGNVYFFFLPIAYWLYLTILMINSEEKWLRDLYGNEYEEYCKRVNRCIPFPPKHSNQNK